MSKREVGPSNIYRSSYVRTDLVVPSSRLLRDTWISLTLKDEGKSNYTRACVVPTPEGRSNRHGMKGKGNFASNSKKKELINFVFSLSLFIRERSQSGQQQVARARSSNQVRQKRGGQEGSSVGIGQLRRRKESLRCRCS